MKNSSVMIAVLALIVTSLRLPLAARERRGSTVEVTMTDGSLIRGELLAVKGHDLIIHDKCRRRGFTVAIE